MPETASHEPSPLFEVAPQGYNIKLDIFEGPLDLLLHLIRKNEVDIYDIPIALITRQYLDYLNLMKELNLDLAGDFLVMASTLLQIKSRMLLPLPDPEDGEGEESEDPRAELVRRLIDYQRYRDAGITLGEREILGREVFARKYPDAVLAEENSAFFSEELELDLFQLVEAFRLLLSKIPLSRAHEVEAQEALSIIDAINQLLNCLNGERFIDFESVFIDQPVTKERMIITFLAVLELCRTRMIKVIQNCRYGTIHIYPAVTEGDNQGDHGYSAA